MQDFITWNHLVELHIQGVCVLVCVCLCVFLHNHGEHLYVYSSGTSMGRSYLFSNATTNVSAP